MKRTGGCAVVSESGETERSAPARQTVRVSVRASQRSIHSIVRGCIEKQGLGQIASTAPVVFGNFFIYGSRSGQVVWHSSGVGYQWRGYQVSPTIRVAPLLVDGVIVAAGSDGRVMVLDS